MKKIYIQPTLTITEMGPTFPLAASSFDLNQSTVEEEDVLVRSNEWADIWEE